MKNTKLTLVLLAALLIPGSANAASTTCTVIKTAWAMDGTVQVMCSTGVWYYALTGSCTVVGLDARKAWLSLAQAAQLSGKPFYMEYTTCGSGNSLSYVRLEN